LYIISSISPGEGVEPMAFRVRSNTAEAQPHVSYFTIVRIFSKVGIRGRALVAERPTAEWSSSLKTPEPGSSAGRGFTPYGW
jgi:hypothetical protein